MKKSFVGIGTGRCGTLSLAVIVNACKNCFVSHENEKFLMPWDSDPKMNDLIEYLQPKNAGLWGDVSLTHNPRIYKLRQHIPDLKVVCLHRPKKEVVDSWKRWCCGDCLTIDRNNRSTQDKTWQARFPQFDTDDPEEGWGKWWELYENMTLEISNAFHIQTKELNSDNKLHELFNYLEIPHQDRIFVPNRIHHSFNKVKLL
jgi:hypothetical protein